jgi:hypothetical protein
VAYLPANVNPAVLLRLEFELKQNKKGLLCPFLFICSYVKGTNQRLPKLISLHAYDNDRAMFYFAEMCCESTAQQFTRSTEQTLQQ